ncbi:uncharacterized protein N7482_009823 [Penicillium canariense]|uniref:Uncharacterized protein n=1 Tax=Penicillium canariense TaxID=189055 RepID=A0A9W9HR93_9EURO|nr:uncharacterized protein N7482_009823 [Penicillium canariense]KAJ5153345.1 hypothetical protein N7482_009823 [Penicillium canariense]
MAAPQPPAVSPRRTRGFSVKSDKSQKTNASGHKSNLSESSEEKARRHLQSKADPSVAMNELQPMAVALQESTMGSLRAMDHKDQQGNLITDPDWSNPTRPRFERPLDTIRSFEAAIYGTYGSTRPVSYARTDDAASQRGDFSRRTSYHGGEEPALPHHASSRSATNQLSAGANGHTNRGYTEQNSYHGRNAQSQPDNIIDAYGGASQAPDNYYPYNQNGSGRRPRHAPRMSSEQGAYSNGNGSGAPNAYQQQNYQRSHDNVAAMAGPGGYADPYGQSADPSLNSSMDQLQQQALQQQRLDERAQAESGPNMNGPAPAAHPMWGGASPANGHLTKNPPPPKAQAPANGDKRKSWFKKRFSKG